MEKKQEKLEVLNVNATDKVQMKDAFGKRQQQLRNKGIAGTFHLTKLENYDTLVNAAWDISGKLGLPAVIVVRAPRKV